MSAITEPGRDEPPLPASIWWFAWSYVAGQVLELIRRGPQSDESWVLSALFGITLVTFVSHGVLRVRWVRFWLVVVLVALAPVLELVGLIDEPSSWGVASLALSSVQAVLLHRYTRTAWFEHQRQRRTGGPSLGSILAVAALVGALGGVLGAEQTGIAPGFDGSYGEPFGLPSVSQP